MPSQNSQKMAHQAIAFRERTFSFSSKGTIGSSDTLSSNCHSNSCGSKRHDKSVSIQSLNAAFASRKRTPKYKAIIYVVCVVLLCGGALAGLVWIFGKLWTRFTCARRGFHDNSINEYYAATIQNGNGTAEAHTSSGLKASSSSYGAVYEATNLLGADVDDLIDEIAQISPEELSSDQSIESRRSQTLNDLFGENPQKNLFQFIDLLYLQFKDHFLKTYFHDDGPSYDDWIRRHTQGMYIWGDDSVDLEKKLDCLGGPLTELAIMTRDVLFKLSRAGDRDATSVALYLTEEPESQTLDLISLKSDRDKLVPLLNALPSAGHGNEGHLRYLFRLFEYCMHIMQKRFVGQVSFINDIGVQKFFGQANRRIQAELQAIQDKVNYSHFPGEPRPSSPVLLSSRFSSPTASFVETALPGKGPETLEGAEEQTEEQLDALGEAALDDPLTVSALLEGNDPESAAAFEKLRALNVDFDLPHGLSIPGPFTESSPPTPSTVSPTSHSGSSASTPVMTASVAPSSVRQQARLRSQETIQWSHQVAGYLADQFTKLAQNPEYLTQLGEERKRAALTKRGTKSKARDTIMEPQVPEGRPMKRVARQVSDSLRERQFKSAGSVISGEE